MSYYKFGKQSLFCFLLLLELCSCFTAGTHGSIKTYEYPIPKPALQNTVKKVILESTDIHIDSVKNYIIDNSEGKSDTIIDNRYNDAEEYLTIKIENDESDKGSYKYIIQYSETEGSESAAKSSISIAYTYDAGDNGGSVGNGGISWDTQSLKRRLVTLFERKFIDRIDKNLGKKHIDSN